MLETSISIKRDTKPVDHNALLAEWKARLGLTDWLIDLVDNVHPDDMKVPDSAGCTEWIESNKWAVIQMLDEKYYGDRIAPFDYEKTLVHELLHLKTCFLTDVDNDLQERLGHQMIEDLARAFVLAKRDGARNG